MTYVREAFWCCLLLTLGCRGDDDDGYPQTCQLSCERAEYCDPQNDLGSCAERCGRSPGDPPLSRRYLEAVRHCLERTSCESAPLSYASEQCERQEALRLSPSKAAKDLCNRAFEADRRCGAATLSTTTCLEDVKLYEDELLKRAARCYESSCRDHGRCINDLLGYGFPTYSARL